MFRPNDELLCLTGFTMILIIHNTMGMNCLRVINASHTKIHQYNNLRRNIHGQQNYGLLGQNMLLSLTLE
jgi:hypothetical protein